MVNFESYTSSGSKAVKHVSRTLVIALLCCVPPVALAAQPASVAVSGCWIRTLPGDLPSGAYFKMTNSSDQAVNLVGVATDAFGMAMLHETENKNGMSSMVRVKQVPVPAHGTSNFAPGKYHVMLEKPKKPVKPGMTLPMTFVFSNSQKVAVECKVKDPSAISY